MLHLYDGLTLEQTATGGQGRAAGVNNGGNGGETGHKAKVVGHAKPIVVVGSAKLDYTMITVTIL